MQVSSSLNRRFIHGSWWLQHVISARIGAAIKEHYGLELSELFVMQRLLQATSHPSELAQAMACPAHAISRKLDSLERAGLVHRQLDPQDARRHLLSLTAQGEEVSKAAWETLQQEVGAMVAGLTPQQLEALVEGMEAIVRSRSGVTKREYKSKLDK